MTTWAEKVEISKRFCEKLRRFNYFKSLGEELYTGWVDHYDDPYYTDGGDYEDDVTEFVESLTDTEKEGLQSFDPGFYMSLIAFYRKILCENYESQSESTTDLEDEFDEDNLNIQYE